MAVTQPTYNYTTQLTLTFSYADGMLSFSVQVDPAQLATMTDAGLNSAINGIMAQIRALQPTGAISCTPMWRSEDGNATGVITYNG